MKKTLSIIFLALLVLIFLPKETFADIINPDYLTARCDPGELKVHCSYSSRGPFDECAKYENNPNYRFLVGTGSTFGGSKIFCFKAVSTSAFITYHAKAILPLLLITLCLETPLFLIFGFRSRKALLAILFANLISVPLFYTATVSLPFSGLIVLVIMELTVIVFEAILIKFMLKENRFKKIFIYSATANAVSAILGSALVSGLL